MFSILNFKVPSEPPSEWETTSWLTPLETKEVVLKCPRLGLMSLLASLRSHILPSSLSLSPQGGNFMSTPTGGEVSTEIAKAQRLMQEIAKLSGDPLMPTQQLQILTILYTNGEMSQQSLDGLTNTTGKATNSRNVLKLGEGNNAYGPGLGLIEQVTDLMDKRAKRVRLTPKGRQVVTKAAQLAGLTPSAPLDPQST